MLQSMGLQKVEHDLGLNNDNDNNLCSLSPYSIPSFKFSPSFQVFFLLYLLILLYWFHRIRFLLF